MKKILIAPTLLIVLGAIALWAQNTNTQPPSPPNPAQMAQHRLEFLTNSLALTSSQQQQAQTIFANAAQASQAVHENLRTAHETLQNAVKANDANAIDAVANTIGTLTAQLTSIEAKAQAAFFQILTTDQQAKLAQMRPRGMHRGFGPGGPPPME